MTLAVHSYISFPYGFPYGIIPRHLGYNISLRVYCARAMKPPSVYPPYHPRSL